MRSPAPAPPIAASLILPAIFLGLQLCTGATIRPNFIGFFYFVVLFFPFQFLLILLFLSLLILLVGAFLHLLILLFLYFNCLFPSQLR